MADPFLEYLHDLFADFGPIRTRAMFGGHGVYAVVEGDADVIIGVVIDEGLYLKADAQTVGRFRDAGCAPFVYEARGKALPMSYWSLPDAAMDSPQAMLPWARLAWEAALRKPLGKPRKPKGRRPR